MSWYREADQSKSVTYSPPQVVEQKLDSGGNYVSPAPDGLESGNGVKHPKPMGTSVIG